MCRRAGWGEGLILSSRCHSFPTSSNCVSFRGRFLTSFFTSLHRAHTLEPALKTHQLSQKRQALDYEGSWWESFNRRGPHPDPPQGEPTEEILKAKLSCPSLSPTHGPENQPRRIRRGLDHRGRRTTRRARSDTAREEGTVSNATECSHRMGLSERNPWTQPCG